MMFQIKVIPVHPYDIQGMEHWLEQCAADGLALVWLGSTICIMKKTQPEHRRFRLEPVRKERTLPEDLAELYRTAGWNYVSRIDGFFLFSSSDPSAEEPYTDHDSHAAALDSLMRLLKTFALRQVVAMLCFLGLFATVLILRPARLLWILLGLPVTGFFWFLWFNVRNCSNWKRLRTIRSALEEGRTPAPQGRAYWQNGIWFLLNVLTLTALVINFAISRAEVPLERNNAPSLMELESVQSVIDREVSCQFKSCTLLAPIYLETSEEIWIDPEKKADQTLPGSSNHYSPSLHTAYYRLTLPFLARAAARSQMDMFRIENLTWTVHETTYPGTDFVWIAECDSHFQMAAIACGSRLAVYRYHGAESLANHLDVLSEPVFS